MSLTQLRYPGPALRSGRASSLGSSALLAYLLFVVYGSLVPLDFQYIPFDEALQRFRTMPFLQLGVESRADWVSNGVLYLPVGFLATWRFMRRGLAAVWAVGIATTFGVALAVGVEFTQVYFPARTVSLNDIVAECIGSLLGALLGSGYQRHASASSATAARLGGTWFASHALQLYAAAYLAFCLFPFDLLISREELAEKLASDMWGGWVAAVEPRPLMVVLKLAVEVALTLPLGILFGRHTGGRKRTPGLVRAAVAGLMLGALIEGAQFLIASGISQGVSVLSRGLGMAFGLALWQRRDRLSLAVARRALARSSLLWLPVCLLLIVAMNGWFTAQRQGGEAAAVKWAELRLLPFYYHYYTTEAQALLSLASVFLMYLPLGVLAWSLRRSAWTAAAWGIAASAVVETAKLWLEGLHPDPTNLLIAGAASAAVVLLDRARAPHAPARTAAAPTATSTAIVPSSSAAPAGIAEPASSLRGDPLGIVLLGAGLAAAAAYYVTGPAFGAASAAVIAVCAGVVWRHPWTAVLVVPALLPVFDFAAWTGRFFWDEFDLLLAVCLGIAYLRTRPARQPPWPRSWVLAFALLAASYLVSVGLGALPWPWPDANSWTSYHSPYNALRIAKGLVWAGLFIGLLGRLVDAGHAMRPVLAAGMALGLAGVVICVVWERAAFVGLFDFAADYRVTGPFSAMHRGGAFVECYLAVAMPFVAWRVVDTSRAAVRWLGIALLLAASYALMVTFSRNGYAAFGATLVLLLWLAARDARGRSGLFAGLLVIAVVAVAWPIVGGPYARERMGASSQDFSVRRAHWADTLEMRDSGVATAVFGMGLGRFPYQHYWRSREASHAGSYALEPQPGATPVLRLGAGATLYLDQIVGSIAPGPHRVGLRFKASRPGALLKLSLCEKWMLTSRSCVGATLEAGDLAGRWTEVESTLDLSPLAARHGRTIKFSLHTPAAETVIDIARVSLQAADGRELLHNGDFAAGLDRWFFSTDVDPPWHIHSLPVAVLFEQGWFGVLAWTVLLCSAGVAGVRNAMAGDRGAAAALAALLAFLVSASLNTLIDEPRFLFLLLLVAASCFASSPRSRLGQARRARGRKGRLGREFASQPRAT